MCEGEGGGKVEAAGPLRAAVATGGALPLEPARAESGRADLPSAHVGLTPGTTGPRSGRGPRRDPNSRAGSSERAARPERSDE